MIKAVTWFSVKEEEKMTMEEINASCDYYTMKIKDVEKSFSDFFHVIKN